MKLIKIKDVKFVGRGKEGSSDREQNIDDRCDVLVEAVNALRPIYIKSTVYQKDFIETVVGAAIWYLPKSSAAWTGKISSAALNSFHPESQTKPKLSEDHVFPRKAAARQILLSEDMTSTNFRKLYRDKYSKLHYITPSENKVLVKFQKADSFREGDDAYSRAGVMLVDATAHELKLIKKGDIGTIERLTAQTMK